MRRLMLPFVVVGLLLGVAIQAQAQDDAKAILEKAIKAHGGEEALTKFKAGRARSKGTIELAGGISFTQETAFMLPDKFKETVDLEVMGQKVNTVTVFNGDKFSIKVNGMELRDMFGEVIKKEMAEAGHLLEIMRLVPLKKDKKFELSLVGEVQVNGKPALGLRVSAKGHNDVSVFFDKETGLMAKVERRATDAMGGPEFTEERFITAYQKVQDLPAAKKVEVHRDGKKFMEVENLEAKFLESIEDNEFVVP
jgi:hypothetical protein